MVDIKQQYLGLIQQVHILLHVIYHVFERK